MILPPGQKVKGSIDVASLDFPALIEELSKKNFTGYVEIMIKGAGGLENGTLIFDAGKIVGATYDYMKYNNMLMGSDAFSRIVNASAAKKGVVDIYQLSAEQIKLTIAFNEKIVFIPAKSDMAKFTGVVFSPFFEEQIKEDEAPSRSSVLKKLKIADVAEAAEHDELETPTEPKASGMLEKLATGKEETKA